MQNLLPKPLEKEQEIYLPDDAKKLLEILDELQNFTANLRKKIMAELKTD